MGKEHRIIVIGYRDNEWIDFIEKQRILSRPEGPLDKLVVDFSKTVFLTPCHLVSLACLIEEYYQAGVQIEFIPATGSPHNYLCNIKFYEYWTVGFDRNRYTQGKINTALCLWKVDQAMIDSYSNEAKIYYERNFFTDRDLGSLSRPLQEVFNNIYDHARSPVSGYVLTQYYPTKKVIRLSVCDFGVGIPNKINEMWEKRNKPSISPENALRAAFRVNLSSKSTPRNKGLGLFYLLSNVKYLAGDLTLWSNSGLLVHKNGASGTIFKRNNKFLQGTLIDVTLRTDCFPQAEETEEDEFYF